MLVKEDPVSLLMSSLYKYIGLISVSTVNNVKLEI